MEARTRANPITARTASGTKPRQYNPGLFSFNTLVRPWMIPARLLIPTLIFSHPGTVAADTDYYPFGTLLDIPGYGRGVVEDRGSAIKGPTRLDIYYRSHSRALQWGRQTGAGNHTKTLNKTRALLQTTIYGSLKKLHLRYSDFWQKKKMFLIKKLIFLLFYPDKAYNVEEI